MKKIGLGQSIKMTLKITSKFLVTFLLAGVESSEESTTLYSVEVAPTPSPSKGCQKWCANHPVPWRAPASSPNANQKCSWAINCGGCPECLAPIQTRTPMPTPITSRPIPTLIPTKNTTRKPSAREKEPSLHPTMKSTQKPTRTWSPSSNSPIRNPSIVPSGDNPSVLHTVILSAPVKMIICANTYMNDETIDWFETNIENTLGAQTMSSNTPVSEINVKVVTAAVQAQHLVHLIPGDPLRFGVLSETNFQELISECEDCQDQNSVPVLVVEVEVHGELFSKDISPYFSFEEKIGRLISDNLETLAESLSLKSFFFDNKKDWCTNSNSSSIKKISNNRSLAFAAVIGGLMGSAVMLAVIVSFRVNGRSSNWRKIRQIGKYVYPTLRKELGSSFKSWRNNSIVSPIDDLESIGHLELDHPLPAITTSTPPHPLDLIQYPQSIDIHSQGSFSAITFRENEMDDASGMEKGAEQIITNDIQAFKWI